MNDNISINAISSKHTSKIVIVSEVQKAIENSTLDDVSKALIANYLAKLTIDNAVKLTELISKIKELFHGDDETTNIVINIIMSL